MRKRPLTLGVCVVAAITTGIAVSSPATSATIRRILPAAPDFPTPHLLEPTLALPRTSLVVAAVRAENLLEAGRPWAAWRELEPFLASEYLTAGSALMAARAAVGWGGWREVRTLLSGKPWLDTAANGEGRRLLARSEESLGLWAVAAESYGRYASRAQGTERGAALARRAAALARADQPAAAAAVYREAARELGPIADWMAVREIEALAQVDHPGTERVPTVAPMGSSVARARWARAGVSVLVASGDTEAAIERLEREMRLLVRQRAVVEGAGLVLEWSRLVGNGPRVAEARDQLRALAWEGSLPPSLRLRAADRLGELAGVATPSEELARAAAYEAGGRPGHAARSLRVAIADGLANDGATRFRLGRLLFEAGDYRPAREVLREVAPELDRELAAEAELMAARARFRAGDRAGGLAELRQLADARGGTAAAGTALFLLADAAAKIEQALPLYRRAASSEAPEAREALYRLGDRRLRLKDSRGAAEAWGEYVGRFPTGEETARLAYSAGQLNLRIGRTAAANVMFNAAVDAEPLSYYALRAGQRIGRDPLQPVLSEPKPWVGLTSDPADAHHVLGRLDLLREAGLEPEWKEELDAAVRRLQERPLALVTLAEGIRDRGEVLEAVRIARSLVNQRDGSWDGRLLRVAFPLPYRELLESEAERYRVDPMLFAGLIRQESMFRPEVRSRVGATGLAQIMPATGRWIAPRIGVPAPSYSETLLTVPELNLRMGALYLGDLMRRYGGAADLALAGYNAGPARADRWRRDLAHERDVDSFRDAIPFNETRNYVKIVLRNAWIYQRLYARPYSESGLSSQLAE